jgi:2-polyprenyl-3-methyl-5-hydroxy-6-metoxy-1,4-benzoquinol methylase
MMNWISESQAQAISDTPHFGGSAYGKSDLNELLNFYMYHFVEPLIEQGQTPKSIADIGTGYGWLAFAFALRMNAKIIAMDYNKERLECAQKIAAILGVSDKIEWVVGSIGNIPLEDRSVDIVYCIEVIEHVGTKPEVIRDLARITRETLVIATPNKFFPIINHDTALPFCHWLPLPLRDVYAKLCGRLSTQDNNMFWSPLTLMAPLKDFERVSRFFQFKSYSEFKKANDQVYRNARPGLVPVLKYVYFGLVSKFGKGSIYFLPNLASTFRRRDL